MKAPDTTPAAAPASDNGTQLQTSTEVFAVYGAEPEVQAYAMAKYSRSALSMRESLRELNEQKAEKFLNTFYFQYGHRSIADLAHVAMAIEKLSLLAAIALVDEQRWDGQERSTRYQQFRKSGWYTPDFSAAPELTTVYDEAIRLLFLEYEVLSEGMWRFLAERTPRPADMKPEAYERTLRARAFDISRYLLPLATNTSLGQIVNARTLESQVSRLLSSRQAEIRSLAELLKAASRQPAYNVNTEKWSALVEQVRAIDEGLGQRVADEVLKPVRVSPTLVKYAEPNAYVQQSRRELRAAAAELMANEAVERAPLVDLLDPDSPEIEIPASLLYEHCRFPYRQIQRRVAALSATRREELIQLGIGHRGRHDELLRAFCSGQQFRFDILMDIGGFRDMHRHRRCIQLLQEFTTAHGFEVPDEVKAGGVQQRYCAVMEQAATAGAHIASRLHEAGDPEAAEKAQYLIPLGYRTRALFKMDFSEVVYISELRSAPAGHISYRRVAYEMYRTVAQRHPSLSGCFRVHDPREPVDILKR